MPEVWIVLFECGAAAEMMVDALVCLTIVFQPRHFEREVWEKNMIFSVWTENKKLTVGRFLGEYPTLCGPGLWAIFSRGFRQRPSLNASTEHGRCCVPGWVSQGFGRFVFP